MYMDNSRPTSLNISELYFIFQVNIKKVGMDADTEVDDLNDVKDQKNGNFGE